LKPQTEESDADTSSKD